MHSDRGAATNEIPRQLPGQRNVTNPGLRQSHSIWTVRDVVTYLRISKSEIYRMAKRGALPCFRIGGQLRFPASEIVKWSSESSEEKKSTKTAEIKSAEFLSGIVAKYL
jgi:excisionase family DNA binding protein